MSEQNDIAVVRATEAQGGGLAELHFQPILAYAGSGSRRTKRFCDPTPRHSTRPSQRGVQAQPFAIYDRRMFHD